MMHIKAELPELETSSVLTTKTMKSAHSDQHRSICGPNEKWQDPDLTPDEFQNQSLQVRASLGALSDRDATEYCGARTM